MTTRAAGPSFWTVVFLLLRAARQRTAGRIRRHIKLRQRRGGIAAAVGPALGFVFVCLLAVALHAGAASDMLIAVSSGGVYRTFDGGASWAAANTGIKATFNPEEQRYPEFGQCVHKVAQDAGDPERLYLQNHNGVYRSDDAQDLPHGSKFTTRGESVALPQDGAVYPRRPQVCREAT